MCPDQPGPDSLGLKTHGFAARGLKLLKMNRLWIAPWALFLAGHVRAQPLPAPKADRLFEESFRAELIRFLAERPANEAAQEAKRFIESAPELHFRCPTRRDSEALDQVSASAVYYGRTDTILVSGDTLRKGGLEPDYARWRFEPHEYRRAIRLIAPILIHELRHAQIRRELGFDAPVKENELLAYAAQARYIAQEPNLATIRNFDAGARALREYIPLLIERARWSVQEGELVFEQGSTVSAERLAVIDEQLRAVRQRLSELDEDMTRRGWTLTDTDLDEYRVWVSFSQGWDAFERSFAYLDKASIFSDAELGAFAFRMGRVLRLSRNLDSKQRPPEEQLNAAAAAIEVFNDPSKVRSARAYFRDRIERLRPLSGRGFAAPMTDVPVQDAELRAERRWSKPLVGSVFLIAFALGVGLGARRRQGSVRVDPEMAAYVREHAPRYGVDAVRQRLLGEGHPAELVEASVAAALKAN